MATMGRKVYGFFAIACIVLLVFATAFAAVRIGGEIEDNTRRARSEFDRMIHSLSASWNGSLQDEAFRQSIRDFFWESPTIMAVLASGSAGPELAMEKNSGLLVWLDGIPRLKPSLAYSKDGLSGTIHGASVASIRLEALALRFDPARMRSILIQALVILLSSVVLALVVMSVVRSSAKDLCAPSERDTNRESGPEPMALDRDIPALAPDALPEDTAFPMPGGTLETDGAGSAAINISPPLEGEDDFEEVPSTINDADTHSPREAQGPEGLYNPASGIGWEAYLPERLNAELHRAASFEQDLVLLVWDMIGESQADAGQLPDTGTIPALLERRAVLASELVRFFSFRDLSFEFGYSGASVILPNMDLDHGLRMAEEFIQQMSRREQGALPREQGTLLSTALRCGVASRHGRLLEPGRLLMEARGALKRAAASGDTAVIAFRSDPERYRELLKRG